MGSLQPGLSFNPLDRAELFHDYMARSARAELKIQVRSTSQDEILARAETIKTRYYV